MQLNDIINSKKEPVQIVNGYRLYFLRESNLYTQLDEVKKLATFHKGGVIHFSTDVNVGGEEGGFLSSLENWMKRKVQTFRNVRDVKGKVTRAISRAREGEVGFTIQKNLVGRYISPTGEIFDESSLSLIIANLTSRELAKVATEVAKAFRQESVLVDDRNPSGEMYLAAAAE
jgi:hypothetical protein